MSAISAWSTTAGSNNSASPDGFPEGMAPSGVNNSAREVMASVRTWYENAEWRAWGHTIAYGSATTFTTAAGDGDTTAIYPAGRRVKVTGTLTGTRYGRITTSSHSSQTTITVALDSGTIQDESAGADDLAVSVGPIPTGAPTLCDVAGVLRADADSTRDLGTTSVRWANLYVDDITTTTSIAVASTLLTNASKTVSTVDTKIGGAVGDTPAARLHVDDTTAKVLHVSSSSTPSSAATGTRLEYYNTGTPGSASTNRTIRLAYFGDSDAGTERLLAYTDIMADDPTNGAEYGAFRYQCITNGSAVESFQVRGDRINVTQDTKIGGSSLNDTPSARLHVEDSGDQFRVSRTGVATQYISTDLSSTVNAVNFQSTGGAEKPVVFDSSLNTGSVAAGFRFQVDGTTELVRIYAAQTNIINDTKIGGAIGDTPAGVLELELPTAALAFTDSIATGTKSTAAGFITITVGGATRYIQTYSA